MNLPTPDEYAKDHGHNPFPPRWEKWLSAARAAILSAQPTAGRHVSIDEHPGKGTVINIDDTSARRGGGGGGEPATGACCLDGDCTITTAAECEGTYQGDDTTCEDVDCGNATSGACCVGTDCSILSPADCSAAGGTYQGDDTTCDPNPCEVLPCPCGSGWLNPDDGLYYLTRHSINTPVDDCPPSETWILDPSGDHVDPSCNPVGWNAPRCFTPGLRVVSLVLDETYNEECELITTHEDVNIETYCECQDEFTNFTSGECGDVVRPDCPIPYPVCQCLHEPINPLFYQDCTSVVTTYTYSNQCIP